MSIELISVVERRGEVNARLRAEACEVGARIRIHIAFRSLPGTSHRDWVEEAYDRALAVLDPA